MNILQIILEPIDPVPGSCPVPVQFSGSVNVQLLHVC